MISSSPDATTQFLGEKETAQRYINELKSKGINHIVLLTHFQYKNDLNLAKSLSGVDIIVGGDSHSLLGDFSEVGLNSQGSYPTIVKNNDGNTVCVVQAWQYSQVVGELNVEFDDMGNVKSCEGTPHLMLADSFKRKNADGKRVEIQGEARTVALNAIRENPSLNLISEDPEAAAILKKFSLKVDELKTRKVGEVVADLCFERIPGQGRSKLCDVSETAKNGSDISNLVAHAFREMTRTSEIAIQNGGGVRIDVPKGDFSIGTAYKLLPFANTIVELEMTGAEISQVLEEALDWALNPDGSTGAYPYAAGLRWDIDASKSIGSRFSNIQFKGPGGSYRPDPEVDWHLLAGDESALPAISASIEALPAAKPCLAFVVVDGPEYEIIIHSDSALQLIWLHRSKVSEPENALLDAIKNFDFPEGEYDVFVHGEAGEVRSIRKHLIADRGIDESKSSISPYWRRNHTDEAWRSIKRQWLADQRNDT